MELLQWHKVCEIGGEELHRAPVVALIIRFFILVRTQISLGKSYCHIKCRMVSLQRQVLT